MVNLINPISASAASIMQISSRQLNQNSGQIATGMRGASDLVDYVIGSKLRDNNTILRSVVKAASYGTNMLKTAESNLISVKEKLTNLQKIIAIANTAHGESLARLNILYQDGVRDIVSVLKSAQFDGRKLFDGTFAGPGQNQVGNKELQDIPKRAQPLAIRIEENITNTIFITIPKLLAGKGTGEDIIDPGRFTPLFPVKDEVGQAVKNFEEQEVDVILNNRNEPTINNRNEPTKSSPIEVRIFDAAYKAYFKIALPYPEDQENSNMDSDIDDLSANGKIVNALDAAIREARAQAQIVSAGDLLSQNNQRLSAKLINDALTTVTELIATIGWQMGNLQQAVGDMVISIKVQSAARDVYLNTNYEEATKKFKTALLAMQGGISIISLSYSLPEAVLELITE